MLGEYRDQIFLAAHHKRCDSCLAAFLDGFRQQLVSFFRAEPELESNRAQNRPAELSLRDEEFDVDVSGLFRSQAFQLFIRDYDILARLIS